MQAVQQPLCSQRTGGIRTIPLCPLTESEDQGCKEHTPLSSHGAGGLGVLETHLCVLSQSQRTGGVTNTPLCPLTELGDQGCREHTPVSSHGARELGVSGTGPASPCPRSTESPCTGFTGEVTSSINSFILSLPFLKINISSALLNFLFTGTPNLACLRALNNWIQLPNLSMKSCVGLIVLHVI